MINIAIDGPAGAGKSTAAKELAKALKMVYIDTGAMYRAAALKAVRLGLDVNDAHNVIQMLQSTVIDIEYEGGRQKILLDGEDVSADIRENSISKAASDISRIKEVRLKLVETQRQIAKKTSVVMDGRDIGTYVLPDADFKFFLTAKAEVRAARRCAELEEKGQKCDYEKTLQEIKERDHNDSTREFAPLRQAEDAILVDSTQLSASGVVAFMLEKINKKTF